MSQGSTIEPLVKFLKVKRQQHRKQTMGEKIASRVGLFVFNNIYTTVLYQILYFVTTLKFIDHVMGGLEDISGQSGHHQLRERWVSDFK